MQLGDLDKMRMGTKYRFPVRLRDYTFMCRPLTVLECTDVAIQTAEDINKRPHLRAVPVMESALFAIKTLSLASTEKPGDPIQLHEAVLQQLTPDELMFLFAEYNAIVDKVSPRLEDIDDERLRALMKEAKKNAGVLIDCSFAEVVGICRLALSMLPADN